MTNDTTAHFMHQACPNPIFIIGSPRSGTSILPWALAHHPRFWTVTESGFLQGLFPRTVLDQAFVTAAAWGWTDALDVDRATFMAHVGLGINVLLTNRSGGRRWIEQTPANTNIAFELAELFPGARFLHMVRDGRRVVHSMQHFRRKLGADLAVGGSLPEWAGDFRSSVHYWRDFVNMSLAFEEQYPDRCLRLRLEDVVADPSGQFQRLFEQLDEAPDPRPAEYFASQRINSSFGDARGMADPTTVHLEPDPFLSWNQDQQQMFLEAGAQTLLALLGYSPSVTFRG